jgi:hypothetical protein
MLVPTVPVVLKALHLVVEEVCRLVLVLLDHLLSHSQRLPVVVHSQRVPVVLVLIQSQVVAIRSLVHILPVPIGAIPTDLVIIVPTVITLDLFLLVLTMVLL